MGSTASPPTAKDEHSRVNPPSPFRAFNPWKATLEECLIARHSTNHPTGADSRRGAKKHDTPLSFGWRETTITFLTDWVPRRIIINLLFHIPSLYISRFESTINKERLSLADLKRLAREELVTKRTRRPPLFELELGPKFVGDFNVTQMALIAWLWIWGLTLWSPRRRMIFQPYDPIIYIFWEWSAICALISSIHHMSLDLVLFPIRRQGPFYDSWQTDIHAYWDLTVALELQDIHQSFYWNTFVDLSMVTVWAIWAYVNIGIFFVLIWLRAKSYIPDEIRLIPLPLAQRILHTTWKYVTIFGIVNFVASINRRRKFNEERVEWVKTGGAIDDDYVLPSPSPAAIPAAMN